MSGHAIQGRAANCERCGLPLDEPKLGHLGMTRVSGVAIAPRQTGPTHFNQTDCASARMYHRGKKAGYDDAVRQIKAATHALKRGRKAS